MSRYPEGSLGHRATAPRGYSTRQVSSSQKHQSSQRSGESLSLRKRDSSEASAQSRHH